MLCIFDVTPMAAREAQLDVHAVCLVFLDTGWELVPAG